MLKSIDYSKMYRCKELKGQQVSFKFTKDEEGTHIVFLMKDLNNKLNSKKILLTTENTIDKFDIDNVNDMLAGQGLELV